MKIDIRVFSGIAPRLSAELLADKFAQTANNISIKSGKIHPEKPFTINSPDRDYVPGQLNDDAYDRLYFLDENGSLCVCGSFGDDETLSSRVVDISVPNTPQIDKVSSPFLESIGAVSDSNAKMIANYKSTSFKAVKGVATHLYSELELKAIDDNWIQNEDGSLERSYEYNPWDTIIYYPENR